MLGNSHWMPEIVNFTFPYDRYVYVVKNILELCSGIQVITWELFDVFRSCFLRYVWHDWSSINLGLILPHYRNETCLSTLLNAPWIMRFSNMRLVEQAIFMAQCEYYFF